MRPLPRNLILQQLKPWMERVQDEGSPALPSDFSMTFRSVEEGTGRPENARVAWRAHPPLTPLSQTHPYVNELCVFYSGDFTRPERGSGFWRSKRSWTRRSGPAKRVTLRPNACPTIVSCLGPGGSPAGARVGFVGR